MIHRRSPERRKWRRQLAAFRSGFFLPCVSLSSPSRPRRKNSPPTRGDLLKTTSTGEGWRLGFNREGRWTEDAQQSRKKKTMKTNKQNNEGTREQIRTVEQQNTEAQGAVAPAPKPDNRLPIDTEARKQNRTLPTPKVLNLLLKALPDVYRTAEVVGKWVWVQFKEQPSAEIRQQLAQLGFHWNRERQAWQHPCGKFSLGSQQDPHEKYSSYHPARVARRSKQPTEAVAA